MPSWPLDVDDVVGVFEVIKEIEEIGARIGDRLGIGETQPWPVSLARHLSHADAQWAFLSEYAAFEFTRPPLPEALALQLLTAHFDLPGRPDHTHFETSVGDIGCQRRESAASTGGAREPGPTSGTSST